MRSVPAALRAQKPKPRRRPRLRGVAPASRRRLQLTLRTRVIAGLVAAAAMLLAWAALARAFAPPGNTDAPRLDAIIVLGASVDSDGNPSPILLSRVTESVREYERGVAPRLILSGASSHGFSEARVMHRAAQAQGVPASAIFEEPAAEDTIQNACFTERIMKAHGWTAAEVVTSTVHLPRANLIFSRLPLHWRGHAAPPLSSASSGSEQTALELLKTARFLLYARWTEACRP